MATLDWSQCAAVESIPGKVSRAWVFKGTRTPVGVVSVSGFRNSFAVPRLAREADSPALHALIEASARGLQAEDYTPAQIERSAGHRAWVGHTEVCLRAR